MAERAGSLAARLVRAAYGRWARLFEGFWAVPLAMTLAALGLALALQWIDAAWLDARIGGILPEFDRDGARMALSVVAGGVISIATLVFSLTFVALSITAQQLSPRILDFVLHERAAQMLLGLSLGGFLFAATALSLGETRGAVKLALATPVALALAALTLSMAVVFAHRMTRVMRAEDMVVRLGDRYVAAVKRGIGPVAGCAMAEAADLPEALDAAPEVVATAAGYVGPIHHPALVAWADEHDLLLDLLVREGDFVLAHQPVARVAGLHGPAADAGERITLCLTLSDRRAPGRTADYEGRSLAEAALRALSPGINDPGTAMSCANRLFEGLTLLAEAGLPERVLAGADGRARARIRRDGVAEALGRLVAPIVEAADDAASRRHLAGLLDTLGRVARDRAARDAIAVLAARLGADGAERTPKSLG